MKAVADLYFDAPYISMAYELTIEIVDNCFFINGIAYDEIVYVKNHNVVYDEVLIWYASNYYLTEYEILQRIQNEEGCYILTPEIRNSYGFLIAIYEIDGAYYFLASYEQDIVLRIHKLIID